jgi:HK97 gp10 family phage protein
MSIQIERKLSAREIAERMRSGAAQANLESANEMAAIMRDTCPVGPDHSDNSPHTRDTITVTPNENGSVAVGIGGAIIFIEFGTHKMPAHPVVVPAFERIKRSHQKRIAEAARIKE